MTGAATVMLAGAVVSTLAYVAPWHRDFPARAYIPNALTTIAADPVPVADVEVPELVQLPIHYPHNLPSHLLAPYGDLVQTTQAGNDLRILDAHGRSSQAGIGGGAVTEPGDEEGCGLRVGSRAQQIELARENMDTFPWTSLNYAASGNGRAQIRFDGRRPYEIDRSPPALTPTSSSATGRTRPWRSARPPPVSSCALTWSGRARSRHCHDEHDRPADVPRARYVRAVASIVVVATHTSFWAGAYGAGLLGAMTQRLEAGVAVFFVLSGFLLSYPWLRHLRTGRPRDSVGRYVFKRVLRILPVYWVAVIAALLLLEQNSSIAPSRWIDNVLLMDMYQKGVLLEGLTQMWSLATEVAFYVRCLR